MTTAMPAPGSDTARVATVLAHLLAAIAAADGIDLRDHPAGWAWGVTADRRDARRLLRRIAPAVELLGGQLSFGLWTGVSGMTYADLRAELPVAMVAALRVDTSLTLVGEALAQVEHEQLRAPGGVRVSVTREDWLRYLDVRAPGARPRGVCAVCRGDVAMLADGTTMAHRPGPDAPSTAAGRPRCPGSSRAPLEPVTAGAQ